MLIVLTPGPDPRLLGRSTRERNVRVAERGGAKVVDARTLDTVAPDTLALLVPRDVVINAILFTDPAFTAAARTSTAFRASSGSGGDVLVGTAGELRRFTSDGSGASDLPQVNVDPDAILPLGSARARRRAAWRILQRTAKKTDGWVARTFNRPMSRPISYVLLSLGLNAGHASFLTLLFGVAAAAVAAQPGYLPIAITGLMFQFASVLDGVDGEMARATLTESEAGARLDTIVDQLTYVTCFIGVTTGWVREAGGLVPLVWTMGVGVALVLSLVRAGRFVATHAENASFVFIDRTVRRAARDTRIGTLRAASAAFTLLRRDVFAAIFLAVALTGVRALIPALIAFGVLVANFTFSYHRRELIDAARLERLPAA